MISLSVANPYEYELDFQALKQAAKTVLEGEGIRDAKIVLAFVDNPHIHRLNKQFLDHDEPTDVLSFPDPNSKKFQGELVIGAEVALAQSIERGHDVQAELTLYVIHGLLHLCGHDDLDEDEAGKMRERERHYLALLGLPDISPRDEE